MRRLIYILLFTVLAIGCRKESPVMNGVEVSISLSSVDISQTKADDPSLKSGSTVRVFVYKKATNPPLLVTEATFKVVDNVGTLHRWSVNDAGDAIDAAAEAENSKILLPSTGDYDFYTISPGISSSSNLVSVATRERDLLYNVTEVLRVKLSGDNPTIPLGSLSHQHSQIQMDIQIKIGEVIGANPIVKIGSGGVVFTGQAAPPVPFNLLTKSFTAASYDQLLEITDPGSFEDITASGEPPIPNIFKRFKLKNPEIIFPKPEGQGYTIATHFDIGGNKNVRLCTARLLNPFESGVSYTFTLKVLDEGVKLFLTPSEWDNRVIGWASNFGGKITYYVGEWDLSNLEYNHGGDAGYGLQAKWTSATWEGDFSGGFGANVVGWPANDQGWADDLGKKVNP